MSGRIYFLVFMNSGGFEGSTGFRVDVTEDVGRKCNDGYAAVTMFLLPASNFFARLIAVLVRHMQIALYSD
jgi:hypothetical protein